MHVDHSDLEVAAKAVDVEPGSDEGFEEASKPRRTCGLRVVTFWLVLALGVIIIGVAIGGGVGGLLAKASLKAESAEAPKNAQ